MVWWKNPCFICLCVWEFFIKRKTSIALQLHLSVLPKPYVDLRETNLYTYVPCCYIELHQTLWPQWDAFHTCLIKIMCTPLAELLHWKSAMPFHPSTKENSNDLSLSSIFQMRHGLSKKKREKRWHAQEAWPKKREKNGHISVHEKKEREKNIFSHVLVLSK